jgi:hypothetical protein
MTAAVRLADDCRVHVDRGEHQDAECERHRDQIFIPRNISFLLQALIIAWQLPAIPAV